VRDLARQAVPELFDFPLDTAVNHMVTNYSPVIDRLGVDAALCKQALDR